MRRIFSIILTVAMILSCFGVTSFAASESPTDMVQDAYGNVYTWSFDAQTGLLKIGVKEDQLNNPNYGAMNFEKADGELMAAINNLYPWRANASNITKIEIDKRITRLARQMFQGMSGLKEITIPAHITAYGWGVFYDCSNLETVRYEFGATTLGGQRMFQNCTKLSKVVIPPTVKTYPTQVFGGCKALKEVLITATYSRISFHTNAFESCSNVKVKYYSGSNAASIISGLKFTSGTATPEAVPAEGTLPDLEGNADSIGWKVENGVATIYDLQPGTGNLPKVAPDAAGESMLPWLNFGTLNEVKVEEGITKLSDKNFDRINVNGTITLPSTLTAADSYVFDNSTVNNLIFKEGCGILNTNHFINRNCKMTNIHLPSTATIISQSLYRGLHKNDSSAYLGSTNITFYAPKDTYAYTWATDTQANVTTDIAGVTINVNYSPSDRIYSYAVSGYKPMTVTDGTYALNGGADGKYDTAFAVSTNSGSANVYFVGPNFDRNNLFSKRAYSVFEADIKFNSNADKFVFGSNSHRAVSFEAYAKSGAVKANDWNKITMVVNYNTGEAKTYINGIYVGSRQEKSSLYKDSTGNTALRIIAYATGNGANNVMYMDNMAVYATDVNPALSFGDALEATAYSETAGVTFTASSSVQGLDKNVVIAAAYDANDNMIGSAVMAANTVTIAPVKGATKYVGYIWNSADALAPISATKVVNAE